MISQAVIAGLDFIKASQYNKLRQDSKVSASLLAHQQTTPDNTLKVEDGTVWFSDVLYVIFAGGNSPAISAPSVNPRIDNLSMNSSGTLVLTGGSENAAPETTKGAVPTGNIPICDIYCRVGGTVVKDTSDGTNHYIIRDLRPFVGVSSLVKVGSSGTADYLNSSYFQQDGVDHIRPSDALVALSDVGSNGILVKTGSGETGATSRTLTGTSGRIVITNGSGVSGNPTFDLGSDVLVNTDTYSNPSWLTSLAASKLSGQVAIADGGTGQSTANAALNALLPSQGSATDKLLKSNGTDASWTSTIYRITTTNVAETVLTLTDGATIAWDANSGAFAKVTLGGNRTLSNPTNLRNGAKYTLMVTQDATGGRTLSFDTAFVFTLGVPPILNSSASAVTILEFTSDGTSLFLDSSILNSISEMGMITSGVLGENVSASDITNNLNLVYRKPSDMKWYKVTSSSATWLYKLGLVLESGSTGETKKILLQGPYANQTFSNIAPTFSSSQTGTDYALGATTGHSARAIKISNSANPEAIVSGGTFSVKKVGTPAGALLLYLVLSQTNSLEQSGYPACYKDTTNHVIRGAIIGTASIAQASVSTSYLTLSFSLAANANIPAGADIFLVAAKTGAADPSNYYVIQGNSNPSGMIVLDSSTMTWSGASGPTTGTYTLTSVSTSPLGYSIKAYTGTNGSYGLTPENRWSKVIGRVLSSTKIYFDPQDNREDDTTTNYSLTATAAGGFRQITTNFCPSKVRVDVLGVTMASTPYPHLNKGYVDCRVSTPGQVTGSGNPSGTYYADHFNDTTGVRIDGTNQAAQISINHHETVGKDQNLLFIERLENGYYLYNGYPSGLNFIDGNASGFTGVRATFYLTAKS